MTYGLRKLVPALLTRGLTVCHMACFSLPRQRNINDKTGLEPSKLYNLVQFLMYDQPGQNEKDPLTVSGTISVDETMKMLYSR